jgi:hypothetical protein
MAMMQGENVLLKHPLKKPDSVIAVLQNQPVLRGIPGEDLETELFIEPPRSFEVLDGQANRKRAKFHALLLAVRIDYRSLFLLASSCARHVKLLSVPPPAQTALAAPPGSAPSK